MHPDTCEMTPEKDFNLTSNLNPFDPSASFVSSLLPTKAKARKEIPIATGVLDYFPAALAAVAEVSWEGNNQHNPGEPLHWARGKSADHADCAVRHLMQRGEFDSDG